MPPPSVAQPITGTPPGPVHAGDEVSDHAQVPVVESLDVAVQPQRRIGRRHGRRRRRRGQHG